MVLSENSSKVLLLCGRQDLAFGTASQSADTFTQIRFHDWNYATSQSGILLKHDTSNRHKPSTLSWCEYPKIPKSYHNITFLKKGSDSEVLSEYSRKRFTAL